MRLLIALLLWSGSLSTIAQEFDDQRINEAIDTASTSDIMVPYVTMHNIWKYGTKEAKEEWANKYGQCYWIWTDLIAIGFTYPNTYELSLSRMPLRAAIGAQIMAKSAGYDSKYAARSIIPRLQGDRRPISYDSVYECTVLEMVLYKHLDERRIAEKQSEIGQMSE